MAEFSYALGYSAREIRRLELQGEAHAAGTERILRMAGLTHGMSVLDIGTGTGDVAMIAARIIGPTGSVLGIDSEASILDRARILADAAGLRTIRYETATPDELPADRSFDLVVGRYVLCDQPDRAAFLRQAAGFVRPGGTLVFMEPDAPEPNLPDTTMHERWSNPPVALFDEVRDLVQIAFKLGGERSRTGGMLVPLFDEAGLPEPQLSRDGPTGGPSSPIVELLCLLLESVLPVLERHNITTRAKLDMDTLQSRVQAAVADAHSQLQYYTIVGAWARID